MYIKNNFVSLHHKTKKDIAMIEIEKRINKQFIAYNTTAYDGGRDSANVFVGSLEEVESLGWERNTAEPLYGTNLERTPSELQVGEILAAAAPYQSEWGAYLVRIV